MLDEVKPGQRLLLALTSEVQSPPGPVALAAGDGILVTICGLLSLMLIAVLCVCRERKAKPTDHQNGGAELNNVEGTTGEEALELRTKPGGDGSGQTIEQTSEVGQAGHMGHTRQASSSSGPPTGLRPTSLRELPEPPVSARHSRNTSMSGVELPAVPDAMPAGLEEGAGDSDSASEEYAYPKHVSPRGAKFGDTGKVKSHSEGYDHLGQNRVQERPTNYDRLIPGKPEDETNSPSSETGQATGSGYSSSKDEDPYNCIGDSDGVVPSSFIRHLRESSDPADPYATVEDESGGDLKSLAMNAGKDSSSNGKSQMVNSLNTHRELQNDYEEAEEANEPEYAVVHKTRGNSQRLALTSNAASESGFRSSDELSSSGVMPPEPPRLYNAYEDEYEIETSRPDHQYSRVTARESLASMSARKALNPYEMVPDGPENMYATVEGGSGDGIVIRHMDSDDNNSNRNSQNSDTYAEIGGVAITSNSNTSRTAVGSTNTSNTTGRDSTSTSSTATMLNSNANSEAPVPPSLDSLHQMTKSQTSNEGDRLYERHLTLSEQAGLEAAGFSRSSAWGEEGSGGSLGEDGYSTLKRIGEEERGSERDNERGAGQAGSSRLSSHSSARQEVTRDSGQHSPDYSLVKEQDNDPNYESVDEARAKMRLLYKTDKSVEEASVKSKTSAEISARNNVTVVRVLHPIKSVSSPSKAKSSVYSLQENDQSQNQPTNTRPRRRPNHDYEELDLSVPTSPSEQTSVPNASSDQTSMPLKSPTQSLAEAKLKLARSHMYEEIHELRLQSPSLSVKIQENSNSSQISSGTPSASPQLHQSSSIASRARSEPMSVSPSAQRENTQGMMSTERNSVGPDHQLSTESLGTSGTGSSNQRASTHSEHVNNDLTTPGGATSRQNPAVSSGSVNKNQAQLTKNGNLDPTENDGQSERKPDHGTRV